MLMEIAPLVRELLTAEQRRKLPTLTVSILDPRYLAAVRDGTSLYAGGSGPNFGVPGGFTAVSVINGSVFFEFR
jgi:hypothetical protein